MPLIGHIAFYTMAGTVVLHWGVTLSFRGSPHEGRE
jgi:hypothetical protein